MKNLKSSEGAPNSSDKLACGCLGNVRGKLTKKAVISEIETHTYSVRMRLTTGYFVIAFGQCRIRGDTRYAARLLSFHLSPTRKSIKKSFLLSAFKRPLRHPLVMPIVPPTRNLSHLGLRHGPGITDHPLTSALFACKRPPTLYQNPFTE